MSDGFTRRNSADQDKKLDAEALSVGGLDVFRPRVQVYSGETLPVLGPLTDAQLRASNVAVGIGDGGTSATRASLNFTEIR